jgi:hypothetical protein
VIRIAITPAAYATIAAALALGTVAVEPERAQDGSMHIWLDPGLLAKLKALRGAGGGDVVDPCRGCDRRNSGAGPVSGKKISTLLSKAAAPAHVQAAAPSSRASPPNRCRLATDNGIMTDLDRPPLTSSSSRS